MEGETDYGLARDYLYNSYRSLVLSRECTLSGRISRWSSIAEESRNGQEKI